MYVHSPLAQVKPFVKNASTLLRWSKRVLSDALVNGIVKRTFFAHFCGGAGTPGALSRGSMSKEVSCRKHNKLRAAHNAVRVALAPSYG